MQIIEVIGAAARLGQDVVDFHNLEGKVRVAADADAFLLAIETMAMGAVVGQYAEIGALWQRVDDICAAP